MKKLLLYSLLVVFAACKGNDEKAKEPEIPQGPLLKSANSAAFNLSFDSLLNKYYALKDDFIAENTKEISLKAEDLLKLTDSLKLGELKGDTLLISTAKTYAMSISSEIKGMFGEETMEGKRKSFQMVSDQLYDLIRTVRYDQAVIYHIYCPMAFNDQGANWLSNTSQIRNPYIPKQMINCGEVKDSIDFRTK